MISSWLSHSLADPAGTPHSLHGSAALEHAEQAGIDIGRVIETVRHRVTSSKRDPGVLFAEDRFYRADFDRSGFSLRLRDSRGAERPSASIGPDLLRSQRRDLPYAETTYDSRPTLNLAVTAAARGTESIPVRPEPWQAAANRATRALAPGLLETVTVREGSLEWDFVLTHAPAGRGDLQIEARATARGAVGRRANGWRWGSKRGVRMGELLVRDARGHELYRALPNLEGSRLFLRVPDRVLARAVYPVTVDPVVSPEYPSADPVIRGAADQQEDSSVAWSGSQFLVVWRDWRAGNPNLDVYGARVTSSGTVLDPTGIPISTASGPQSDPEVAWNGTEFFVVWSDFRSGTTSDVYGARVSNDGVVLDPGGVAISTAAGDQVGPMLASRGQVALVVWQSRRSGATWDVYGRFVKGGSVGREVTISTAAGAQWRPAVAWVSSRLGPKHFQVVWMDHRAGFTADIYGARVNSSGKLLDASGVAISTAPGDQEEPRIGVVADIDDATALVVWSDWASLENPNVYGRRLTDGGARIGGAIPISTAAHMEYGATVSSDGSQFYVLWQDGRANPSGHPADIYGARVTRSGSVTDATGFLVGTGGSTPELARSGAGFLVSFATAGANGDISARFMTRPCQTTRKFVPCKREGSTFLVSTGAPEQVRPAVAWDGTNFLVVWQERRAAPDWDIYGARVTPGGTILDGSGIPISTATAGQRSPAVAWNGSTFLVVWYAVRNGLDIYGARVDSAGNVVDPAGIPISTGTQLEADPAVASDGDGFLVVWIDRRLINNQDIYGVRLGASGAKVGPEIPFATATNAQRRPAVAWNGSRYLIVWEDRRSSTNYDVYATSLAPGTSAPGTEIAISAGGKNEAFPDVASNGSESLIVWADGRNGTDDAFGGSSNFDIFGARVNATATAALDPVPIATGSDKQAQPAVGWDGAHYVTAWVNDPLGMPSVSARRIAADGAAVDASSYLFTPTARRSASGIEPNVAVAPGPAGRTAVVYDRFALESPYVAERVFIRFLDAGPQAVTKAPPKVTLCHKGKTIKLLKSQVKDAPQAR